MANSALFVRGCPEKQRVPDSCSANGRTFHAVTLPAPLMTQSGLTGQVGSGKQEERATVPITVG